VKTSRELKEFWSDQWRHYQFRFVSALAAGLLSLFLGWWSGPERLVAFYVAVICFVCCWIFLALNFLYVYSAFCRFKAHRD
jgi:hypothetical protein